MQLHAYQHVLAEADRYVAGSEWDIGSRALVLAVVGCHVGVAGADVLVAGGARRDAAAALAAGAARPKAHLGPPRLAAPVRAARAAVCMRSTNQPTPFIIFARSHTSINL